MSIAKGKSRAKQLVSQAATQLVIPPAYSALRVILDNPHGSSLQMSSSLAASPELASRLIAMLSGPLYGKQAGRWSIERAVNQLGMQRVLDLSLVSSLPEAFRGMEEGVAASRFWPLAVHCGAAARLVAQQCARSERERVLAAGMLVPAGLALLWQLEPDAMQRVERDSDRAPDRRIALEREHAGTDHLWMSAALARHWQLPAPIVRALDCCDAPAGAVPHHREAAVLKLARTLAAMPGAGRDADALALQMLGLTDEQLGEARRQLGAMSRALSALLPGSASTPDAAS